MLWRFNILIKIFVVILCLGAISGIVFLSVQAKTVNTSVVVSTQYNLSQNNFRFYAPIDSYNPVDVWPPGSYDLPENVNLTLGDFPIQQGQIIRLRTSLTANATIPINSVRFKLQFKSKGTSCSADEPWYDFGLAGSNVAWRGFDMSDLNDNVSLPGSPLLSGSDMNGVYNEFGDTGWNSQAIPSGNDIEYDWVIQNYTAAYGCNNYCFRVVQVDSNNNTVPMPTYNRYIEVETPPSYVDTGSNTINYATGGSFYMTNPDSTKFYIEPPANYSSVSMDFMMYAFNKDDIMSTINPPTGRNTVGNYIYQAQVQKDSCPYSNTFDHPITVKISYNDSDVSNYNESTLQISRWNGSEWIDFSSTVDTVNNTISATTSNFSYFGVFGEEISCGDGSCNGTETCNSCPGDCGVCSTTEGGIVRPITNPEQIAYYTRVIFEGKAYPEANINILKDGQFLTSLKADSKADFRTEIKDLNSGTYTFGFWTEDKNGLKSSTFTITFYVVPGVTTTVSGILLPPTVKISKSTLLKGEGLEISGQAIPDGKITIFIYQIKPFLKEIFQDVAITDFQGNWFYLFDTKNLKEGIYEIKVRTSSREGLLSIFSKALSFEITLVKPLVPPIPPTPPIPPKPPVPPVPGICPSADLNKDGRVNFIDFSIILYLWGKASDCADQNADGKIDLIDFSVMMYYWTG